MKKVLLIELDYHPEVLSGLHKLLNDSHQVYVISLSEILNRTSIDSGSDNVIDIPRKRDISSTLQAKLAWINGMDLILFTTAQSKFKVLSKLTFSPPVVVLVHNIHSYFDRWKINPTLDPFLLRKDFSYFIRVILFRSDWYYRPRFLKKVDHFLFPSKATFEYAKANYPAHRKKLVPHPIEWIFTEKVEAKDHENINITIIGTIDQRRRDYRSIVLLIKFLGDHNHPKVKFTFAGKSQGRAGMAIRKKLASLSSKNIEIETFDEYITEEKLSQIMSTTDFIIAPILEQTRHHIWKEIYGKTKISGNINDIIKYQKASLIPSFYKPPLEISSSVIGYSDQKNLNAKTLKWISEQGFLNTKFDELNTHHEKPAVLNRLTSLIDKLTI